MIHILVKNGARLNIRDRRGWTAIHLAASNNHTQALMSLLNAHDDVNVFSEDGKTPLMMAVINACTDVVDLLMQKGARLGMCDQRVCTALHLAVCNNQVSVLKVLLSSHANISALSGDKWTPLMTEASEGYTDVVDSLIQHGACLYINNLTGRSVYVNVVDDRLLYDGSE